MSLPQKIREEFPELERIVHLNSAALSLMPEGAKRAMAQAIVDREYTTEKRTAIRDGRNLEARKKIARLIHASPEDLCLVANTSEGLNIMAQGLDYRPGDNIVLSDVELGGNIVPWLNLEKRGVRIKRAGTTYGQDPADKILATIDDRTRLVTVSFVGWIDGYRTDLAAIGKTCAERGILFVVDGIQGIGAMTLDVAAAGISFLSCGAQKWLLSPNGTGFIYVRKSVLSMINQAYLGYLSIDNEAEGTFDFVVRAKPDAMRLQIGSINDKGVAAMNESLSLILEAGIESIQEHVIELNRYAAAELRKKGYTIVTSLDPDHMSGILTFRGPQTSDLYARLIGQGIIVSLRNGWIRIGSHLYNNRADIDRLLAAV